jgi:two-component system, chemotaxis family, chemotaxis protein CheY
VLDTQGRTHLSPVTPHMDRTPIVLVVDDDPDILEALSEILEAEGFGVRRAKNGLEALDRLGPVAPDLVLLDLMMPVMDGWEFAQKMRQKDEFSRVPIIVLSADRNVGSKAKEIGAVGHLAKPFELNDLLDMVRTYLPPSGSSEQPSR